VPDPVVSLDEEIDPEDEALLADSVGLAMQPAEKDKRIRHGGHPDTRGFGELLIDLEADKAARAVVFGLLWEIERR
jgi:hypothetical protein